MKEIIFKRLFERNNRSSTRDSFERHVSNLQGLMIPFVYNNRLQFGKFIPSCSTLHHVSHANKDYLDLENFVTHQHGARPPFTVGMVLTFCTDCYGGAKHRHLTGIKLCYPLSPPLHPFLLENTSIHTQVNRRIIKI